VPQAAEVLSERCISAGDATARHAPLKRAPTEWGQGVFISYSHRSPWWEFRQFRRGARPISASRNRGRTLRSRQIDERWLRCYLCGMRYQRPLQHGALSPAPQL